MFLNKSYNSPNTCRFSNMCRFLRSNGLLFSPRSNILRFSIDDRSRFFLFLCKDNVSNCDKEDK